jgi:hypothetical protein
MGDQDMGDPLAGVSDEERRIMERLLRMPPEPHKDAPKPTGARAEGQRRRRLKEREHPSGTPSRG